MASTPSEPYRAGDVVIDASERVVRASIDRPKSVNALNEGVVAGLEHAVELAGREGVVLLVLRGAGGNFCAGADLKHVSSLFHDLDAGLFPYIGRLRKVCDALTDGPFVSLAAVEGYALAGGYEIVTACDLAVATTGARIGDRHLEYALAPALGASVHVTRQLSSKRSRYLAFTGNILSGEEAAAWGLVSHAWPVDEFEMRLNALVERLATRSPAALRSYKRMLLRAERLDVDAALKEEMAAFQEFQRSSPDGRAGVERFESERADKRQSQTS